MKPKDVMKWKEADWKNRVVYMLPSSGGVVGVVFVWVDKRPPGKPKPPTSQFVIKPIQGSAAPTKFAEFILRKVAGAASLHTRGIKHSPQAAHGVGKVVEETLLKFKNRESNGDIRARWDEIWRHYQNADCYLIQETQTSIREFQEEYKTLWGLSTLLTTASLMESLGKLFVADAMIGNGDRLYKLNTGNILFKPNGQLCAIDSTTILTNYQAVLNDVTKGSWFLMDPYHEVKQTPSVWAKGVVNPGCVGRAPLAVPSPKQQEAYNTDGRAPVLPTSYGLEQVFDPKDWYENEFKRYLVIQLREKNLSDQQPDDFEWEVGKKYFLKGVEIGMKEVDKKLSGLNWLLVKFTYKKYVSKYGGDPNLDWTNFKVRRLYFKLRRKGMNQEQAMAEVNAYVQRKLHLDR